MQIGGDVESHFIDDVQGRADFTNPQQDLFPDIPTLDPHLPKSAKMEIVGKIGTYRVVKADSMISAEQAAENRRYHEDNEVDYVLFDRNKVVGWVGLIMPPKRQWRIHELEGTAGQVGSIYLDAPYRGQNLGIKLYPMDARQRLRLSSRRRVADDGWREALAQGTQLACVRCHGVRQTHRDVAQTVGRQRLQSGVHTDDTLIPWMTLRGKANELMTND